MGMMSAFPDAWSVWCQLSGCIAGDVALTGDDKPELVRYLRYALTIIHLPEEKSARQVADVLMYRIDHIYSTAGI